MLFRACNGRDIGRHDRETAFQGEEEPGSTGIILIQDRQSSTTIFLWGFAVLFFELAAEMRRTVKAKAECQLRNRVICK